MIVCQRFLKSFSAFRRYPYWKPAHCNLEKHCFSRHKWNFFAVPHQNLSIYADNQAPGPADIKASQLDDMYLLGDLDSFLLNYKDALYPDTTDDTVKLLKECQLASDILKTIDQIESPTTEQLVQAVLTLRGFQKFLESNQEGTIPDFVLKFRDFQAVLKSSSFEKLSESIVDHIPRMNLEELTYCILYLQRFNVPKVTLTKLVNSFVNILNSSEEIDISESALARVCTVLRDMSDLYSFHIMKDIVPIVFTRLDSCSDFETFRKLTICLQKMVPILGVDSVKRFIEKSRILLQKSDDIATKSSRVRSVLEVILLLNFKTWQRQFSSYQKELFQSLSGSVKYLTVLEISALYDVASENLDCDPLVKEMNQTIGDWLSDPTALSDSRKLYVQSIFPKMKHSDLVPEQMLKFYSEKPLSPNELYADLNNFYFWLHSLDNTLLKKSSDVFWSRVLEYFHNFPSFITVDKLMWISLRYLSFHYFKRCTSVPFEKQMYQYLVSIFFDDENSLIAPKDYVKMGLMIAFYQPYLNNFSNSVWDRIVDNMSRLNPQVNTSVSFILKMMLKRMQKTERFSKFLPQYMNMLAALNNNSFEHLSYPGNLSFEVLTGILGAFQYRELVRTHPLFELICDRLKETPLECMDAKYIRDCVQYMLACSHLEPQLTDTMIAYIIAEKERLQLILLNIVLNYIFLFAYTPRNCEEFIDAVKEITLRNVDDTLPNVIIKIALALCYYNDLPIELSDCIFNVEFFNKLDSQIQMSPYKYLLKQTRQSLMELNRAVCLQYPERDIPWFHEKYCQELKSLEKRGEDYFFDEVSQKLREIIPTKDSILKHCNSPYYHKIDFLIHTNRKGEPVDPNSCASSNLRKIAVLLARELSSSTYYKGKGRKDMLIRQLELLDYRVIVVDKKVWNSMHMSEPFAKENYLCSLIWPR